MTEENTSARGRMRGQIYMSNQDAQTTKDIAAITEMRKRYQATYAEGDVDTALQPFSSSLTIAF